MGGHWLYEHRAYGNDPVAESYWPATVSDKLEFRQAEGDISCEVAIIGGGYTGLNAALELAREGVDVVLVDAHQPAWGASGRNGGFCCEGGTKLSHRQLLRRYGAEETATWHRTQRAAIDLVEDLLKAHQIEADRHSDGETLLAHNPQAAAALPKLAEEFHAAHGLKAAVLPASELPQHGLAGPGFHGAMTTPLGFALNPMKYAQGLIRVAVERGVRIFGNTPVNAMAPVGKGWRLATDNALIHAQKLILATNGYSADGLPVWISNRFLPVQSDILVTRPLTQDELASSSFTSRQMCYDSRTLLHYFRLLPDNRLLFGSRGAIRADARSFAEMGARMRRELAAMFPAWAHVETPFHWSGLACVTANRTPFAGPLGALPNGFGAFAYHGNGVSMGSYCGRLVADHVLGRKSLRPAPRFLSAPPGRFALGRNRRALLKLAYRWYQWRDG